MRRNVIYVVQGENHGEMDFWYQSTDTSVHLFTAKYRKVAHNYFRQGRSVGELRKHKSWRKNKYLCNLIENRLKRELKKVS